ncbi:hypothetical protein ACLOJK_013159 [Asimina triloba]
MAAPNNLKVVQVSRVGPPPGSVADAVLPLTFSDVYMPQIPPVDRLFFYQFPRDPAFTTTHFIDTLLPKIKHSLSLALQPFFPLAGNLVLSPTTGEDEIRYVDGDTVCVTISESEADFHRLSANGPREIAELSPLIPRLLIPGSQRQPLLAVQVTVFPESGICLGTSVHHVVADGTSSIHFMKSWASICRLGAENSSHISAPSHDRSVLAHLDGLKRLILEQMGSIKIDHIAKSIKPPGNMELATLVMRRADIEKLRQRVVAQQAEDGRKPLRCSSFVLTCAYVWACQARSYIDSGKDKTIYFGFGVNARERLDPPIPSAYFGNCLATCFVHAKGSELAAEDGLRKAIQLIGGAIQELDDDGVLKDAEDWLPRVAVMANQRTLLTAGSPKFGVYETDFGWGRPIKVEIVSVGNTAGMSLAESRDEEGGIEVGVALPSSEMERFSYLFEKGL